MSEVSQNIFKYIEEERMEFFERIGMLSAEENLRFESLGIKDRGKQYQVDSWLCSDKHAETVADIERIVREMEIEESIASMEGEPHY